MTEGTRLRASIIILTKNGERYLHSLLDGLYGQTGIERCEVIVIDSGSTDRTLAILADYPRLRLVRIPPAEFGHGRTRNLGARLAGGEFLVYLPQDATPEVPDWLESLLAAFADPAVAGVYGRQLPRADASAMEAFFLNRTYGEGPLVRRLPPGAVGNLSDCFFSTVSGAVRAELLARFPFREDIIMSEDQAWSATVMRAGHAIAYEPRARVLHSHQYGVADVFRRNFDSGYSVWQIHGGATGIALTAAAGALLREALYVLRRGRPRDWIAFIPYEAARHLGFWLGLRADALPPAWRRAWSNLKYFWDQRVTAGGD